MSTHTPGPWERRSIPGHLFEIHDANNNPVFRIRGGMNPMLADARLIAAAPELLAALQAIIANVETPAKNEGQLAALVLQIEDTARAAIAKATQAEARTQGTAATT